eukprot:13780584-Alexandrium_andersonii.AAC.1
MNQGSCPGGRSGRVPPPGDVCQGPQALNPVGARHAVAPRSGRARATPPPLSGGPAGVGEQ